MPQFMVLIFMISLELRHFSSPSLLLIFIVMLSFLFFPEWNRDVFSTQSDPLNNLSDIYEEKQLAVEDELKVGGVKAGSNAIHALMIKR